MSARLPTAGALHLLVVYLVWGSTYFAVKLCVSGTAPIAAVPLQAARMACAALLLAAVARVVGGPPGRVDGRTLLLCVVSGLLMWVGGNGLATLASPYASSSFIVMAMGTIPLWSVAIACVAERRRPGPLVLGGLLAGLVGLAMVVAPALGRDHAAAVLPGQAWLAVGLLCAASITWALGTRLQRNVGPGLHPAWVSTLQVAAAAAVLVPVAAWRGVSWPAAPDALQWTAFAYLVVFGSVVAMLSYLAAVRQLGAVVASTFAYVNPLVGMALGWLFLRERIAPLSLAGFAVVLAGLALVLHANRPGSRRHPRI
ncbi:DMT family transporter [Bordetella sp. 2513F-2]